MLSEQQWMTICGPATGYLGNADPSSARYAESPSFAGTWKAGPRSNQLGHNDIRMIAGLRGDINDALELRLLLAAGGEHYQESYLNEFDTERMANALDVIEDPDTGEWVCRSGSDDGCVPWNIFQEGAVTQEAIDYISAVGVMYGTVSTEVFNLTCHQRLGILRRDHAQRDARESRSRSAPSIARKP